MVRAKFQCHSVLPVCNNKGEVLGYNINLSAVYNDRNGQRNEENQKYWEATPAGNLQMWTVNKVAADSFKQGQNYYLDFTEAD